MTKYIYIAALILSLSGCSGIPKDAFSLAESNLEDRQLQSRNFANAKEGSLLTSCIEILENMGYKTEIVDTELGLVTATKNENHSGAKALLVSILSAGLASADEDQIIKATFITSPSRTSDAYISRLTFHRMVFNSRGEVTGVELLRDKKMYSMFYERLSASVFIEPDNI
jgi:hypothetical protein